MRSEPNPLYKGPPSPLSRPMLVGSIALLVASEVWLLLSGRFVLAAVVAAVSIPLVAPTLRRDWTRSDEPQHTDR
jgi:hypothetical protein